MAADPILTVFHQENSTSGRVGDRLRERGYELVACCPAAGDELPQSLDGYAGIISFGGGMSANDDHLPFIQAELDWLPQVIAARVPLLGICLGAQLIARLLGGNVESIAGERARVGYFPLKLTPLGETLIGDPSAPGEAIAFYHWHSEGFALGAKAESLAPGEGDHCQVFRWGDRTFGVQFHPEATEEMIRRHAEEAGEMKDTEVTQPLDKILSEHERWREPVEQWIDRLLDVWLEPRS